MKILAALLILIVASEYLHASAGPPPFTNGSPLVSGVDGFYQATARGKNLTGVFRFTYANGIQTSSPQLPTGNTVPNLLTDPYNDYVFFVEGLVYRGLVQANINVESIAGVLDNGSANVPVFADMAGGLGILSFMNGFFVGCMDQNSPYACFSGKGEVTVTDATPSEDGDFIFSGSSQVKFKFRGVRNATGTTTLSTTTTTTSGSTTSG
jgi:hypothetical protein